MSKTLRTAATVVGFVALAVATYGASIGPTAAGLAGSAGIAGLSVTAAGGILGATAAVRSLSAAIVGRIA